MAWSPYRHLDIACAPDILSMNLTLTGELGYVMFIPSEYALHVFDAIMDAGSDLGIKHCGYYAMHALRIEKFFAFWGQASFSINQSTYGLLEN